MNPHENKAHKGWLMSGAGNTFAIEIISSDKLISGARAQEICERFLVDGYLGLLETNGNEFNWNFFNSDGSSAEFCGNAARCAQDFLKHQKNSSHSKHKTTAGLVLSWTEEEKNWVLMPKPKIQEEEKTILRENQEWKVVYSHTGVPHFVPEQPKLRHDV